MVLTCWEFSPIHLGNSSWYAILVPCLVIRHFLGKAAVENRGGYLSLRCWCYLVKLCRRADWKCVHCIVVVADRNTICCARFPHLPLCVLELVTKSCRHAAVLSISILSALFPRNFLSLCSIRLSSKFFLFCIICGMFDKCCNACAISAFNTNVFDLLPVFIAAGYFTYLF